MDRFVVVRGAMVQLKSNHRSFHVGTTLNIGNGPRAEWLCLNSNCHSCAVHQVGLCQQDVGLRLVCGLHMHACIYVNGQYHSRAELADAITVRSKRVGPGNDVVIQEQNPVSCTFSDPTVTCGRNAHIFWLHPHSDAALVPVAHHHRHIDVMVIVVV